MLMEKFKKQFTDYNIVFACKTGSELFCSNSRDTDYIVVVDNLDRAFKRHHIDNTDYFCKTIGEFKKMATMQSGKFYDLYSLSLLYGEVMEGQNPIRNYDWFDHQRKAIDVALRCGERNYFAEKMKFYNSNGDSICGKRMIWALAIYYTILNKSTTFTKEQKRQIQRCHDRQLPREKARCLQEQLVLIKNSI